MNGITRTTVLIGMLSFSLGMTTTAVAEQVVNGTQNLTIKKNSKTGKVKFIGADQGQDLSTINKSAFSSSQSATAVVEQFAPMFGLKEPSKHLLTKKITTKANNATIIRYQQTYQGLPVIGGELVVNLGPDGQLLSMSGEVAPELTFSTVAEITSSAAGDTAIEAVAKWYGADQPVLSTSEPKLAVYDPALITPSTAPAHLVWQLEVTSSGNKKIREYVLINANNGAISLHFNMIDNARNRETYTANGTGVFQATLVCDESQPNCTGGTDIDADFAHIYAGDTYDFFQQRHGRDGIDNAGLTMVSTVHWNDGFSCPNAFWTGSEMVYCDFLSQSDDVVGHELTHGVTEYTSNLFYYYQSGAINESLSDVWGEFVDLTNGKGNDSDGVRWLMGEDIPGLGVIRSMKDPTVYQDPDKMSSTYYFTGSGDNGGVHFNSGVNNKAVYLMTDGDTFNGYTVTGLGINKVAAIYYEVQTNLLTSGSDYGDLYNALYQGCLNLIGTDNITQADCNEVRDATNAVEMNLEPSAGFNPEASLCPGSLVPTGADIFNDDMESGAGNWSFVPLSTQNTWSIASGYAASGTRSLYGYNVATLSDSVAMMTNSVSLPAGSQSQLFFRHAFGFDTFNGVTYDGGIIEYSLDNGANWSPASPLIADGLAYNGTISSSSNNPLAGTNAYVGDSHGYVSTRLDLSALAGSVIRFRWRVATDSVAAALGWVVDDVRIYNCAASTHTANAGTDQTVYVSQPVTLDASASTGNGLTYSWSQTAGTAVTLTGGTTATPTFTSPAAPTTLTFSVDVTDSSPATLSDTVNVTVQALPALVANAGTDITANAGSGVVLDASASSGAIASYAWVQTAGTTANIIGATTDTPTFIAPLVAAAETLTFEVTVTDVGGNTATDLVDVNLVIPTLVANAGADRIVNLNRTVVLSAQASQGAITDYNWTQISGAAVALSNATTATPSFTANVLSALEFELTVTDSTSATATDTVIISVGGNYSGGPLTSVNTNGEGGGSALGLGSLFALMLLPLLLRRRVKKLLSF